MRHYLVCIFLANIVCLSAGNVFVKVCDPNDLSEGKIAYHECDPNTCDPNDLSTELMVGQTISFVLISDSNDLWSGGFFLEGDNRGLGTLSGRGQDPNSRDWPGSHLPHAGQDAFVSEWRDSAIWGFELYNDMKRTDGPTQTPGDWFVVDYTATAAGSAAVEFRDYNYSWDVPDPNVHLVFNQIPTRDFNNDGIVNLIDFQAFANDWQTSYQDPNDYPITDIIQDGSVDLLDLIAFSDYWLWGAPEPVTPSMPDPDVFYSIVDVNGLDEITLHTGDCVTLYIGQNSLEQDILSFDLEVDISDPNLGWIDNDPAGSTAILTTPRFEMFDYIGPGFQQAEGIEIFAVNFNGINDGTLAAFVYTATGVGDVTLYMVNHGTSNAALTPILIHQVAPPVDAVQTLEEIWASGELSETTTQQEWDTFMSSVKQAQTND
ncbi:MAG: hypothetical protein ACYTET_03845, partial [Planctomycetota bacterium]